MKYTNFYKLDKNDENNQGVGIWLNIFKCEDMWFTVPEFALKHNHLRKKKLIFIFTFIKWEFRIEIPYKLVGYKYYGRDMTKIMEKKVNGKIL